MNKRMKNEMVDRDLRPLYRKSGLSGLWHLMTGFKKLFWGAAISIAGAALFKALSMYYLKFFIDNLVSGASNMLTIFLPLFIVLALLESVGTYRKGKLSAKLSENVALRLRNYLFDHTQKLPLTFHDGIKTGELLERLTSDVDCIRKFYAEQAPLDAVRAQIRGWRVEPS